MINIGYNNLSDKKKESFWNIIAAALGVIPVIGNTVPVIQETIKFFKKDNSIQIIYDMLSNIQTDGIPSFEVENVNAAVIKALNIIQPQPLSSFSISAQERIRFKNIIVEKYLKEKIEKTVENDINRYIDDTLNVLLSPSTIIILEPVRNSILTLFNKLLGLDEKMDLAHTSLERMQSNLNQYQLRCDFILERIRALDTSFLQYIENYQLPPLVNHNRFSYLNSKLRFEGRDEENELIKTFLKYPGIAVWGISGHGGSGKSKFARYIADEGYEGYKAIWLDEKTLDEVLAHHEFFCPRKLLFICDYAADSEAQIELLVRKMIEYNTTAKFLLIERQYTWYHLFCMRNVYSNDVTYHSYVHPIDLDQYPLSHTACGEIICNFAKEIYNKTIDSYNIEQIINKTEELSSHDADNQKSTRCLFLLLLTDAFLRKESILNWDQSALIQNYFDHSVMILCRKQNYSKDTVESGYASLAISTACGGLNWESNDVDIIKDQMSVIKQALHNNNSVKKLFSLLSEVSEEDSTETFITPLKPDLIGEFLFLREWDSCFVDQKCLWINAILHSEYGCTFLARSLSDWFNKGRDFRKLLRDNNRLRTTIIAHASYYSEVLRNAIHTTTDFAKAWDFLSDFDTLRNMDVSFRTINIVEKYIESIEYIITITDSNGRNKCLECINALPFDSLVINNIEDKTTIRKIYCSLANVFTELSMFNEANFYYRKLFVITEQNESDIIAANSYHNRGWLNYKSDNIDDSIRDYIEAISIMNSQDQIVEPQLAMYYNHLALAYTEIKDDRALTYYQRALAIQEPFYGVEHPIVARTYNNIGLHYYQKDLYDQAMIEYNKAMRIMRKYNVINKYAAMYIHNYAAALYKKKSYKKAIKHLRRALQQKIVVLGDSDPSVATTYNMMGRVYKAMRDYKNAIKYFELSLGIRLNALPPTHSYTRLTQEDLNECRILLGQNSE